MHPPSNRDLAIERALRARGQETDRISPGAWKVAMANGAAIDLRVRVVDEDWLVLTAPCPKTTHFKHLLASDAAAWWPFLRLNTRLNGGARLVQDEGELELRAELFVGIEADELHDDTAPIEERVRTSCEDMRCAYHEARDLSPETSADTEENAWSEPPDARQLARLCAEAGWSAEAHESGETHVALDTRTSAFRASLFTCKSSLWDPLESTCRHASLSIL